MESSRTCLNSFQPNFRIANSSEQRLMEVDRIVPDPRGVFGNAMGFWRFIEVPIVREQEVRMP